MIIIIIIYSSTNLTRTSLHAVKGATSSGCIHTLTHTDTHEHARSQANVFKL